MKTAYQLAMCMSFTCTAVIIIVIVVLDQTGCFNLFHRSEESTLEFPPDKYLPNKDEHPEDSLISKNESLYDNDTTNTGFPSPLFPAEDEDKDYILSTSTTELTIPETSESSQTTTLSDTTNYVSTQQWTTSSTTTTTTTNKPKTSTTTTKTWRITTTTTTKKPTPPTRKWTTTPPHRTTTNMKAHVTNKPNPTNPRG